MPGQIMNNIPFGMCRVVEYKLDTYEEKCWGDFSSGEAVSMADVYNMGRNDPMSPVCFVYNHNGEIVRSEQSV